MGAISYAPNIGNFRTYVKPIIAKKNVAEALLAYRDAAALRERLANANPANSDRASDLAGVDGKIGDVLMGEAHVDEAIEAFTAQRTILKRLVDLDASKRVWRQNLAAALGKIGGLLIIDKRKPEAASSLAEGHAILVELRQQAPDDDALAKSIAWFEAQIADLDK